MSTDTTIALISAAPIVIGAFWWLNRIATDSRRIADAVLGFTDKRTNTIHIGLSEQIDKIREHQVRHDERLRAIESQLDPTYKGGLTDRLVSAEGNSISILATVRQIGEESSALRAEVRKALHDATAARAEAKAPALIVGFQVNAYAKRVREVLGNPDLPTDPVDVERLLDGREDD